MSKRDRVTVYTSLEALDEAAGVMHKTAPTTKTIRVSAELFKNLVLDHTKMAAALEDRDVRVIWEGEVAGST